MKRSDLLALAERLNPDTLSRTDILIAAADLRDAAALIEQMAQRVPLTDEQMTLIYRRAFGLFDSRPVGLTIKFVRAIEEAHGIRSEK